MARAQQQSNWHAQPAEAREEWNNLRDELETLLDQVQERQGRLQMEPQRSVAPAPVQQPGSPPDQRRRDALLSVQRAVQRFNEHEEATDMPAQSEERLQSAIEQIRASQNRSFQRAAATAPRAEPANSNVFADLKSAIGEISERMSRFEGLLEGRDRSGAMVEEIAQQMEQLTSVVEMLANSVGEQSHIKRIEGQIARLAESVQTGPDLDITTFSERLEVLSQAFERLSALQSEQQMPVIPDYSHHLSALDDGVRLVSDRMRDLNLGSVQSGIGQVSDKLDAMDFSAIEACVRSVYDRIDTLENNIAVPTPAIERLTRDLAEFTEVMRNGKGPVVSSTLVTRVDALNSRLSELENTGQPIEGLKFDMEELRLAVGSAIEPRFSAIETQLGSLSDQFAAPSPLDASHSLAGLEGQIKRLADRLDQTGDELTQLQTLYAEAPQFPEMPDFSALADMVASRAQAALAETAKAKSAPPVPAGLKADDLHALEQRLSQLFETQRPETPVQDLSGVEHSLSTVNGRLKSLEDMLRHADRKQQTTVSTEFADTPAPVKESRTQALDDTAAIDEFGNAENDPEEADTTDLTTGKRRLHPGLDDAPAPSDQSLKPSHLIDGLRDAMPRAPSDEVPLNAPAYPEPRASFGRADSSGRVPVPASLQSDEQDYAVLDNQDAEEFSGDDEFDVETAASLAPLIGEDAGPPPAPTSDFASEQNAVRARQAEGLKTRRDDSARSEEPVEADDATTSRSTFIAAARRAAQQNNPPEATDSGAQSLFGRALARFQQKREQNGSAETEAAVEAPIPAPEVEAEAADRSEPKRPKFKLRIPFVNQYDDELPVEELDDLTVRESESVLSKYRRPILLGAAVVAVGFLTLNLVGQRLNSGGDGTTTVSANALGGAADSAEPAESVAVPEVDGRPVNSADETPPETDFPVGSIGDTTPEQQTDMRVIDPTPMAEMPAPLELASFTPEQAMEQPTQVGLPEGLGPLPLRDAALNGDARAQFEVAAIFAEGRAVPQDLAASARWYERSAAQGFAPAAYRLGNMYENGSGVAVDLVKAQFWYEKAAGYGNRMSMHNLASILAGGALGEQDFAGASVWFEKAAGLGLTDSQFNLGMLYARGLGVPQDLASSYKWFSIAADAGDEDAMQARDDVARSLDAETVSRLQADLSNWSPQRINIPANFAPIGTWDDAFDPGPQVENRDIILRVQAALNKLGYDVGIPDGVIGPKTHDAVREFEGATGMAESGEINPRLLAVLGSQPV